MKNNQAWAFLSTKWLMLSVLLLALTACGFHLKGMGPNAKASFQSIYLSQTAGVRADVLRTLTQLLKASDVQIVEISKDAELILALEPTGYQVSRTSISGQGDTTSELLKMSQTFGVELQNAQAERTPLLTATVSSYRDRRIQTAAALASNRELQDIQLQMAFDVANQVIDRINRAYQRQAKTPVETEVAAQKNAKVKPTLDDSTPALEVQP